MTTLRVLPQSLLLVLLVGCGSNAPRTVQVICQETPAYSSRWGSESQSSVSLGNSFQVVDASFSSRLLISGAQGDTGTARFLDPACVAPFPLQGQARWIQTPLTATTKTGEPGSRQPGPGWQIGDEVEALTLNESWVPPGQTALLSKGAILGFVPTTALGEKPPAPEQYTQVLRTLLSSAAFDQALSLTRRASGLFPQEALFQRLLGHLVTLNGGKPPKPSRPLPKLDPLPDIFPEQPLVLSEEESSTEEEIAVYSMAVGLRIREEADPSSKILATLNVNQPLGLVSFGGFGAEWAQVRFSPGHQLKLAYTGEALEFLDVPTVTGYVFQRFLGRQPLDAGQLLTRGQEALKAGRSEEAIVLMHRALEAQPGQGLESSNAAYTGLVQASFDSGRFENLFQSITDRKRTRPVGEARVQPGHPLLLMGCHGELARAKLLDLRDSDGVWAGLGKAASLMNEPHVCVGGVDTREPVEPAFYVHCEEEECPPPPGFHHAVDLYENTLLPEFEKWQDRVASYFDSSPYLFFTPTDVGGQLQDKHLVFYAIPLRGMDSEIDPSVMLDKDNAHVVVLRLPRSTDWKQLQVWLELPSSHLNAKFGLALVDTEEQVREWIKQREGVLVYPQFRVPEGIEDQGFKVTTDPFPIVELTSLVSTSHALEYWWHAY